MLDKFKQHFEFLINQLGISFVAFSALFIPNEPYHLYFLFGLGCIFVSNFLVGGPRKGENIHVVFMSRVFALTYEVAISVLPTGLYMIVSNKDVQIGAFVTVGCLSIIFFFGKYELLFKQLFLSSKGGKENECGKHCYCDNCRNSC